MYGSSAGSWSVEFSGQMTRSGAGGAAAAHPRGQRLGRGRVVLGHRRGAQQVGQVAGVRHVALDRGDDGARLARPRPLSAGRSAAARRERHHRRPARAAGQRRARRDPAARLAVQRPGRCRAEEQPGQAAAVSAMRKVRNAGPPIATQRTSAPSPGSSPAAPREALPWPPVPYCLGQHPPARHGEWPAAQPQQQPLTEASTVKMMVSAMASAAQAYQATLTSQEEREKKARPKMAPAARASRPLPPQGQDQQRRPDSRQRPESRRRERGGQGEAACQRCQQRQRRPAFGGRAQGARYAAAGTAGLGLVSRTVPPLQEP